MRFIPLVPLVIGMAAFSLAGCTTYHDVALQQKRRGSIANITCCSRRSMSATG